MKKAKKMSPRRAAYQARQEKEGRKVVIWICAVLVILAICFMAYSIAIVS